MNKKTESNQKEKKQSLFLKTFFNLGNLEIIPCLIIVSILFIPTLTRPWLIYDERSIFEGTHFPTPTSIGEFFETIESFGLNFNIISSNAIYSSNYITRTSPLGQLIGMTLAFLFKAKPFFYHLFNFSFHLINTFLVYLILKNLLNGETLNKTNSLIKRYFIFILTMLWAVHPVMIEPVLLATNFGALVSYCFLFSFTLDFLLKRESNKASSLRRYIIPFLFLVPMMINEYIVTTPFILFTISLYLNRKKGDFRTALKASYQETSPYFYGLVLYLAYFVLFTHYQSGHLFEKNSLIIFFERIFWLAPQIFFHMIKLIFYPNHLSVDQTLFVKLGNTLSDPYSLFCITFMAAWLFIPLTLFALKKRLSNTFLLCWTSFFGLLPFLHILMPSYTLAAERYLYCPLAFLIIGIGKLVYDLLFIKQKKIYQITGYVATVLLSFSLILCMVRSVYRASDWKDNFSFISSSYETTTNPLFKGMRLGMLAKALSVYEPNRKEEIKNYFINSLVLLKEAKKDITEKQEKYQNKLPLITKSYGLDYDSILTKIAFLEASTLSIDFNGGSKLGLSILEPYIKDLRKTDPRVLELYAHLLVQDKNYKKATKVLLAANSTYPNNSFILSNLIDFYTLYKKDNKKAEQYLIKALRLYSYDPNILQKAASFYQDQKNPLLAARFAYLHGLRTHSKLAYQIALSNFLTSGDVRSSKKCVEKLLKISSNDPETLYFISKYYYQINDRQKALLYLIEAFKQTQDPNTNPKLRFDIAHNLAKLYVFLGNKETAVKLSQAQGFLELAGNDKDSLVKLAKLYKSLGLTKETQICITKIKSLKG